VLTDPIGVSCLSNCLNFRRNTSHLDENGRCNERICSAVCLFSDTSVGPTRLESSRRRKSTSFGYLIPMKIAAVGYRRGMLPVTMLIASTEILFARCRARPGRQRYLTSISASPHGASRHPFVLHDRSPPIFRPDGLAYEKAR